MSRQFSFNKVYVIESLFSTETKTGENLYNDLLRWKAAKPDILESELIQVNNRMEFFNCIEEIKSQIINDNKFPFIHLEIHGSSNKDGLVLNSRQLITWLELANRFREINILTKHNLVVSLATCYGAYIYSETRLVDKAPFWGFVAPWDEVDSVDIEGSFNSFFDTLLTTFDFNESIKKLNESNTLPYRYHFYNAEEVFDRVYDKYEIESYSQENYQKRVFELMSEALTDYNVRTTMTILEVRQFIENQLIKGKENFRIEYRKRFLME